jgi:hypothetical protein
MIDLDPRSTALVLIGLQNGIIGRKLEPLSFETPVERGKALAEHARTMRQIFPRISRTADSASVVVQRA